MDITERLLEVPTMGHDAGCVMEAAEEIKRLRQALHDIADPFAKWHRELEAGSRLSGAMCIHLANDPETYRRMARDALGA